MLAAVLVAGNVPLMPSPVEEVTPIHGQYPRALHCLPTTQNINTFLRHASIGDGRLLTTHIQWHTACSTAHALRCCVPLDLVQVMPYAIKRVSNYSLPDVPLGNCDGDETRDEPACSTEEGAMEEEDEEEGPGGSNVALGQHSTAERHKHYINTEQDLKEKVTFVTQSCLQLV